MPFASKGYAAAYQVALHNALLKMWDWSEGGRYQLVVDTTSCTHTLYQGYYSSNIPCEIGMSEATGKAYMSIAYLVERASQRT